jgi:hypothetical protein
MTSMGYSAHTQFKAKKPEDANAINHIMQEWVPIMFKEEPNMHRYTVLGCNTHTSPGYPTQVEEVCKANVIMQWKSK